MHRYCNSVAVVSAAGLLSVLFLSEMVLFYVEIVLYPQLQSDEGQPTTTSTKTNHQFCCIF